MSNEMNTPPFSSGAQKIIDAAFTLAREKGHSLVATEHLALALCMSDSRAIHWAAHESFPHEMEPIKSLRMVIIEWLESRPLFRQVVIEGKSADPSFSPAMSRVISIAAQIGSGPIQDGDVLYETGLIASEYLFGGLLIEGTGVGADAFTRISSGKVNSRAFLKAFAIDDVRILRPDASEGKWNDFQKGTIARPLMPWVPGCSFHQLPSDLPTAPTDGSNWLIPSKLIIGEHPSKRDVAALISAGIDTFVSLIGEYSFESYSTQQYPSMVAPEELQTVEFVHFPVRDFNVVPNDSLMRLVDELKRRIFQGHTMYIHCRGGHGRTGMVVIPLMCAIFDIPFAEAQKYVVHSTGHSRRNDMQYPQYVHLPETDEQTAAARYVELYVRKRTR